MNHPMTQSGLDRICTVGKPKKWAHSAGGIITPRVPKRVRPEARLTATGNMIPSGICARPRQFVHELLHDILGLPRAVEPVPPHGQTTLGCVQPESAT